MFERVLLAVDLDEAASWKTALPQAVEMVRASGGTLHVVSVSPDAGSPMAEGFFPVDFREKSLERLDRELAGLVAREVPSDVKAERHAAFGPIAERIIEAAQDTRCDVVVMASHKPDAIRDFIIGSNADRVVRRSPVSVLVVRG